MRVIVAQLGARQHYIVPKLCHDAGMLARLHTDFWNPIPSPLQSVAQRVGGRLGRRMLGRSDLAIPTDRVMAHTLPAAYWQLRLKRAGSRAIEYNVHRKWGSTFASRVARQLEADQPTAFFGFSSASLEALKAAKSLSALAVLDEIAPTHLEDEIVAAEQERFPDWEPTGMPTPRAFLERIEQEWEEADRIVVNSVWSRDALVQRGVCTEKVYVVPMIYQAPQRAVAVKTRCADDPLKVLWLGSISLRKGFPYALEAARQLEGHPVTFTFAGPSDIDLSMVRWPTNATYIGQVPRTDVEALWRDHHVFLLPTLSDGFAITQIEALGHGLPLIVTPNCGDVVEDRRNGLLIPPRDPRAIADAVISFLDGGIQLEEASCHALASAKNFSTESVWPILRAVLTRPTRHATI